MMIGCNAKLSEELSESLYLSCYLSSRQAHSRDISRDKTVSQPILGKELVPGLKMKHCFEPDSLEACLLSSFIKLNQLLPPGEETEG